MGQDEVFDYAGVIIDTEDIGGRLFYKILVLKTSRPEKRDFERVASWYLRKIGDRLFVAYD